MRGCTGAKRLTAPPAAWLTASSAARLTGSLAAWLTGSPAAWSTAPPAAWLTASLAAWLTGSPATWSTAWPPRSGHAGTLRYDSVSVTTDAASAISLLSNGVSLSPRHDMIARTMGALSGGHTTAMSLRAP